jgi:NADPH:quinone reductase-like Zn-dependent oxidoreductase
MQAIVQTRYGEPQEVLELREIDMPEVGDDEVLVRVRATSVHADVWHVVSGRPILVRLAGAGLFRPKDLVPGTDLAGVVESVGRNVSRFEVGDAVFGEGHMKMQWRHWGTFAEYAAVPEGALALKPENVSFEQAASVPTSGYIALINLTGREDCKRVLNPTGIYVIIGHDHYGAAGGRILGNLPHFFKLVALGPFDRHLPTMGFSMPGKAEIMTDLKELSIQG